MHAVFIRQSKFSKDVFSQLLGIKFATSCGFWYIF